MSELNFDANNTVLGRMENMSRTDAIALGKAVCASLGDTNCHGAIWPGAITLLPDGSAALDKPLEGEILNLSADALEYAAPELFWHDKRGPAADVYSIGMMLYCAMNKGVNPFYPTEGEVGVKERADSLRRRMKGEALPPLTGCGKKLSSAIMCAVSYDETERYQSVSELFIALDECPVLPAQYLGFTPAALLESDPTLAKALDEEMGTHSVAEAEARQAAHKEYKVAKNFETAEEAKRKPMLPLIAVGVIIAAVVLMLLCLRACDSDPAKTPGASPSISPVIDTSPSPSPSADPSESESPDVSTSPDVSASPAASPGASTPIGESTAPSQSPATSPGAIVTTPTPTPTQRPTPTPTPTATPTPSAPTTVTSGNYTLVMENVSWETAKARCEAMGGHLAVIHNEDELNDIIEMAEELGASYVWLGAKRNADTGEMEWVTGETIDFYDWDINEPSLKDGYDGTAEDYLLLWKVAFGDHFGWKYNDSRPDLYGYSNSIFGGKIAYICQMD